MIGNIATYMTIGKLDATRRRIVRLTVNYNVKMDVKEIRPMTGLSENCTELSA
jgi:hypothetical protein